MFWMPLWLTMAQADPVAEALDAVVLVAQGSTVCAGVVVSGDGRVATAYHCVAAGGRPRITTRQGQITIGRVVAVDRAQDLAIVAASGLSGTPWLPVRPDLPEPGEPVFALGHPYGSVAPTGYFESTLRWSMSSGVVSAVGARSVQFSAPINPGNSGGPVVDASGQVVSIVSRRVGSGEGLGFGARTDRLGALVRGAEVRPLGPLGGTWSILPLISAWEGSGGLLSYGLRVEMAFRDRVLLGVSGRWAASTQWAALQFGEVHWAGPEARLGARQRFGRGRFAVRSDLYGGALWIGGLQGGIAQNAVDLTPLPPRLVPLVGAQVGVGAAALDVGWVPTGSGLVASVVLQWPGVVSVF